MTGIRQPHHFHPMHEGEVENKEDVKPWRLPFWTEPPHWVVEKEKQEKANAEAEQEESQEELNLPTAEELENIRREAYNDGLEQGLVEGRQQGRNEGYDAGHDEGYKNGFGEGKAAGNKEGLQAGKKQGLLEGQTDIDAIVADLTRVMRQLQATLNERDEMLPEVLAAMVAGMCEHVLQSELQYGARNIYQYVKHALDELPTGEKNIHVFIAAKDAEHLQSRLEASGEEIHYSIDETLTAGECRVESEHSLIEYSTGEHLNQLLERVLPMLMHQAATFPDEAEQIQEPAKKKATPQQPAAGQTESVTDEIPAPENTAPAVDEDSSAGTVEEAGKKLSEDPGAEMDLTDNSATTETPVTNAEEPPDEPE